MKEHPLPFSRAMVLATLAGEKTRTRRVMLPQPSNVWGQGVTLQDPEHFTAHVRIPGEEIDPWIRCPYGKAGDWLWVRESYQLEVPADFRARSESGLACSVRCCYSADNSRREITLSPAETQRLAARKSDPEDVQPARFMFRSCCRLLLEVTEIRVERLQEITLDEAIAEGLPVSNRIAQQRGYHGPLLLGRDWTSANALLNFPFVWDQLNADRGYGWDANPYVWVVGFRRVEVTP